MEPPAIISDTPFPSRAIFLPSGHTYADPGGLSNAGAAYLYQLEANGSATYLTKVTAPDGADQRLFRIPFPSRAIFWPSGQLARGTDPERRKLLPLPQFPDWSDAGAAYLYQLEANGSTTIPNQWLPLPMEPPKYGGDYFGRWIKVVMDSVSQSIDQGIFLENVGAYRLFYADPKKWIVPMPDSGLSLSIGSQWGRYLPDQSVTAPDGITALIVSFLLCINFGGYATPGSWNLFSVSKSGNILD